MAMFSTTEPLTLVTIGGHDSVGFASCCVYVGDLDFSGEKWDNVEFAMNKSLAVLMMLVLHVL